MASNRKPTPDQPTPARTQREYGHSSGDRNTRSDEHEWPEFEGGTQRTEPGETPAPPNPVLRPWRSSH